MKTVIEGLPPVTLLGADALFAFQPQRDCPGMYLTPLRARQASIMYSTLQGLERRKLIEFDWTARRNPSWMLAKLTERGKAYRVVLDTQYAAAGGKGPNRGGILR